MHYHAYEMAHAFITPMRIGAHMVQELNSSVFNPFAHTPVGKSVAAACEVFEGVTRRYGKPSFGIDEIMMGGLPVPISEEIVMRKPFGDLLHFARDEEVCGKRYDPKVLILAPLSGHFATLLRGTVRSMLPDHNLYITDWRDARNIPLIYGSFDFDDYVDYVIDFIRFLGPNTHVVAVCQPAVPAVVAAAVMAAQDDPCQPDSLTLMGGPIDTRRNPTEVNKLAQSRSISWFKRNVISRVPFPHAGALREVYPGFIQLSGFMTMNMDRHVTAHAELYNNLVKGDCDSVEQHKKFYDEYLSVMDLPAEFYLQTVKTVFQDHALPDRTLTHRGELVDCRAITKTALMTVEGEKDDICGIGQTEAAHDLCPNIPTGERVHYVQPGVGHYGVFNGTRWRTEIQPRIREMIRAVQFKRRTGAMPTVQAAVDVAEATAAPAPKPAATPKAPAKTQAGRPEGEGIEHQGRDRSEAERQGRNRGSAEASGNAEDAGKTQAGRPEGEGIEHQGRDRSEAERQGRKRGSTEAGGNAEAARQTKAGRPEGEGGEPQDRDRSQAERQGRSRGSAQAGGNAEGAGKAQASCQCRKQGRAEDSRVRQDSGE